MKNLVLKQNKRAKRLGKMLKELRLLGKVDWKNYFTIWFLQTIVGVLEAYYWRRFVNGTISIHVWLTFIGIDGVLIYASSYVFPQFKTQLHKAFALTHHNLYAKLDPEYKRTFNTDDFYSKITEAWNEFRYGVCHIIDFTPVVIKIMAYMFQIFNESTFVFFYLIVVNIVVMVVIYHNTKKFMKICNEFTKNNGVQIQIAKKQYSLYGKFIDIDNRIGEIIMNNEQGRIKNSTFREAFWIRMESVNNFLNIAIIIPLISYDFGIILLVVYIESLITSIIKKIGIFDHCEHKVAPLHKIEESYVFRTDKSANIEVPRELTITGISKSYEGRNYKLSQSVNLHITQGDIIQVCGKSGSGKSSLFGIISGSYKVCYELFSGPDQIIGGFRDFSPGQIVEFQQNVGKLNIVESFRDMAATFVDNPTDEELIKILKIMELYDWWSTEQFSFDKVYKDISGGQKSRLNIAAAFMQLIRLKPKIIMFDEITSDIDSATSTAIWQNIFTEFAGSTILFVNHDINVQFKNNIKFWHINDGTISI